MKQETIESAEVLRLEPHGPDTFVGESPRYEWGRIYGGLVIAQALRAAMRTVDSEGHAVHSLHAYFILGGNPREPVRYEVDRLRNGRSFTTRQVVARQSSGAILNLSASFQKPEEGPDVSSVTFPRDVRPPEGLSRSGWGVALDLRVELESTSPPRIRQWVRFTDPIADDRDDHYAALAYLSDAGLMDTVFVAHPLPHGARSRDEIFMAASLDHVVWFHRPVRADQWLLFDMRPEQLIGSRGLATGNVFTRDGVLVATLAQQGLVRLRRATGADPARKEPLPKAGGPG